MKGREVKPFNKIIPLQFETAEGIISGEIAINLAMNEIGAPIVNPSKDIIWVKPSGDDRDDGFSSRTAKRTLQAAVDTVAPGGYVVMQGGDYYSGALIRNKGGADGKAIKIISQNPGDAVISGLWPSAAEGNVDWRDDGDGVYSAPMGNCFIGATMEGVDSKMLFRFKSQRDLRSGTLKVKGKTYHKPAYGFAHERDRLYLRLPKKQDPRGVPVALCEKFSQDLIKIENSPYLTIDGVGVSGGGDGDAIVSDRKSHHVTLRNIVATHCRRMATIADHSKVHWCDYSYPGMRSFVDDLITLNGDRDPGIFALVKDYNHKDGHPGNALLEGGIIEQAEDKESYNCEVAYCHMHEVFDGLRLGPLTDSSAFRNVINYAYDDCIEFEHWRKSSSTSRNKVFENLLMNPRGSFISHQDSSGGMEGPHYVFRNILWITDPRHSHPAYIIKNRRLKASHKIYYYNNILMNVAGHNPGWGLTNYLYWPEDGNKQRPENITLRNNIIVMADGISGKGQPRADNNLLVADRPYPALLGASGAYIGRRVKDIGFKDPDNGDWSIAEMPKAAEGVGNEIDASWPTGGADLSVFRTPGPFNYGEQMPTNWPRPIGMTFNVIEDV